VDFSLLSKYKISYPETQMASSLDSALSACGKIGFPLAMKVVSPQVLHKSDLGGVMLGIKSKAEAEKAYHLLMERYRGVRVEGVLVQRMAGGKDAVELIVGGKKDAQFGVWPAYHAWHGRHIRRSIQGCHLPRLPDKRRGREKHDKGA